MEDIELNEMPQNEHQNTHPAFRMQTTSRYPPLSSTLISDPDSYNPPSANAESSWSHRRLLNWLRIHDYNDAPTPAGATFSMTRDVGPDEFHLAMTGYDQVFERVFTPWDNLFAMLSTMGIATSVPAVLFLVSIYAGGPKAALVNWIFIGGFSVILALCLGEIAASMPTSAGLYFYSYRLGGEKLGRGPFLAWVTAWLSW